MLPQIKNEIRVTYQAKVLNKGSAITKSLDDVIIDWFEKDRWFRLSGLEMSQWQIMLIHWATSRAEGPLSITIPRSAGSNVELSSRNSMFTIDKSGSFTLEEYQALQLVTTEGDRKTIHIMQESITRRSSSFYAMAYSILKDGFGATQVEALTTIHLTDSEIPVKINIGRDSVYKEIPRKDVAFSVQFPTDQFDIQKVAKAVIFTDKTTG